MNESDETLRYLETACRPQPVERPLYCPQCLHGRSKSGKVKFYACAWCGFEFESLAELITVEMKKPTP